MTGPLPPSELTRMVRARPLPGGPVVIEASPDECAALAARFGLSAINRLRAEVQLEARPRAVRATGTLAAEVVQPCAVSLEDFTVSITAPIDLRFVPQAARPAAGDEDAEIALEADDCDEIAYEGEMFDLGEAVAQTLGLAIDPYAQGPDADAARAAAGILREGEAQGPLAALLAGLKKD